MSTETKTRILVVDDDRDLVEILALVLEDAGYQVIAAYSAPEALASIAAHRPDLVILDVMMPEATEGFHVVWTLRSQPDDYARTVPILMLTAVHRQTPLRFYPESGDGTYRAGEFLDVQDFVDKPVDPGVLIQKVERILRAARVAGQAH